MSLSALSAALQSVGAIRVYTAAIGHNVDDLHIQLIARWPGTPDEVAWHSVDDWPGANREDYAAIASLVEQLRQRLTSGPKEQREKIY